MTKLTKSTWLSQIPIITSIASTAILVAVRRVVVVVGDIGDVDVGVVVPSVVTPSSSPVPPAAAPVVHVHAPSPAPAVPPAAPAPAKHGTHHHPGGEVAHAAVAAVTDNHC